MQWVTLRTQNLLPTLKGPMFSFQEENVRGNKRVGKASLNSFEGEMNMKNRKHWLKMKLQTLDLFLIQHVFTAI